MNIGQSYENWMNERGEREPTDCPSCIGTGIGNPHIEGSVCSACNGRGFIQRPKAPTDEDRWAWNHFEPEPGDDVTDAAEGAQS
jgi:hypothetical protein